MKKTLATLLFFTTFCTNANAKNGAFIGLDAIRTNTTNRYLQETGNKTNSDVNISYGISAGYNFDFNKIFLAPEIFYDKIGTSNKAFLCPTGGDHYCKDSVNVSNRYGAKVNLGYEVIKNAKIFINGGYANVSMNQKYINGYTEITGGRTFIKSNRNGIFSYGIGASYNVNDNVAIRTSYEISKFQVIHQNYSLPKPIDKIKLDLVKVGLVYIF